MARAWYAPFSNHLIISLDNPENYPEIDGGDAVE